jgi:hypothetical protein
MSILKCTVTQYLLARPLSLNLVTSSKVQTATGDEAERQELYQDFSTVIRSVDAADDVYMRKYEYAMGRKEILATSLCNCSVEHLHSFA